MKRPNQGRRIVVALRAAPLITLLATTAWAQSGLRGRYFDSSTPPPAGTAGDFERIDPRIDFSWSLDSPDGTTIEADDAYSERWTGLVHASAPGAWTFTTLSNDGARLWVNGTLVIDHWSQHFNQERSGTISLPAAGWYPIQLEHFNQGGSAVIRLSFEGTLRKTSTAAISATTLAPHSGRRVLASQTRWI